MTTNIDAHDQFCASLGICGARDIRGGRTTFYGIGPNGWCKLPMGHGPWHSQDPEGRGGYVIVLDHGSAFIAPGASPVFRCEP